MAAAVDYIAPLLGATALTCFVAGVCTMRLFVTTTRADQLRLVAAARRRVVAPPPPPPTNDDASATASADDYSNDVDAAEISEATQRAATLFSRVLERRTEARVVAATPPDLVAAIVARSRHARATRALTPPAMER